MRKRVGYTFIQQFRARLHASRVEFRPAMIKFSFYMRVFILGSWDDSRPARVEFMSPIPHKHFTRGTFIPGRPFTWHFSHVSSRNDPLSRCLGQGWNRVNSNKKTTRYRDEFIRGRKSFRGKNSRANEPLVITLFTASTASEITGSGTKIGSYKQNGRKLKTQPVRCQKDVENQ